MKKVILILSGCFVIVLLTLILKHSEKSEDENCSLWAGSFMGAKR